MGGVSRTTRVGPVDGFWATVDEWAAEVVEPSRVRAWWTSRCRLEAVAGPYLDVTGGAAALDRRLTPVRDPVANRGIAVADDDVLRSALVDAGVPFRVVPAARRYRWNGPLLTPVVLELHVRRTSGRRGPPSASAASPPPSAPLAAPPPSPRSRASSPPSATNPSNARTTCRRGAVGAEQHRRSAASAEPHC